MRDINTILAKHFSGETIPEEDRLVEEFKNENLQEYLAIKALWSSNSTKIAQYDATTAWDKVQISASKSEIKNQNNSTRNIMLVAFLLLVVLAGGYLLMNKNSINEIKATENGEAVILADGSTINLRKGAVLSYPDKFGKESREVQLKGEAFFDIKRNPSKPFIVHTQHSDIEVLGTSFNIDADSKMSKITVATGKVKVENADKSKSQILTPNQSATVAQNVISFNPSSDKNELAWKSGEFIFENTDLRKVIDDLRSFYGDKINLSNSADDCPLTANFSNEKLENILKIIKLSCGLELNQNNDNYELY